MARNQDQEYDLQRLSNSTQALPTQQRGQGHRSYSLQYPTPSIQPNQQTSDFGQGSSGQQPHSGFSSPQQSHFSYQQSYPGTPTPPYFGSPASSTAGAKYHRHGGSVRSDLQPRRPISRRHGSSEQSGYYPPQDQQMQLPPGSATETVVGNSFSSDRSGRNLQSPSQYPTYIPPSSRQGPSESHNLENGMHQSTSGTRDFSSAGLENQRIEIAHNSSACDQLGRDRAGRTRQRNNRHLFGPRFSFWHKILKPGIITTESQKRRFKDVLQRQEDYFHEENSFLDPKFGRLEPLVVQAVDKVLDIPKKSTWRRTFVRNVSPLAARVANWAMDFTADPGGWNFSDWALLAAKWPVACIALLLLTPFSLKVNSKSRNGSCYDPIPYRDWNYCSYPRNKHERNPTLEVEGRLTVQQQRFSTLEAREWNAATDTREDRLGSTTALELDLSFNPESNRALRPRYLCFVDDFDRCGRVSEYHACNVAEWMKEKKWPSHPGYLFVAWTKQQIRSVKDQDDLLRLAVEATRKQGLLAFWLSTKCIKYDDDSDIAEDVWRMSDIVRGASAMAIVLGKNDPRSSSGRAALLKEWGQRMWTLPEALLSPKGDVMIYQLEFSQSSPIAKKDLAVLAWKDSPISRQLMDHFEGSVILTPLELVVIALRCLNHRDTTIHDFGPRIHGEMAYVLMGLLRKRPEVNLNDSDFQAFARLSLANDSHKLLERLACVMPKYPKLPWFDTRDYWDAQLWDIYPLCQVAGIAKNDSIILDGAYGASIQWERFEQVHYEAKSSFRRTFSRIVLRFNLLLFLVGVIATLVSSVILPLYIFAIVLLVISLGIAISSPYLVRSLYSGKLWNTQALFFGFEGYMDIATIETHIFGAYMKRLSWSPFSSSLSRHAPGYGDECDGLDPVSDSNTEQLVEAAYTLRSHGAQQNHRRIFTLIDTYNMTVTLFEAERPPVAVLVCGSEGGMQRSVLCSYDSINNTFCREAVLRMDTNVLNRMARVSRLRFCFKRSMLSRGDS